ncbi:MAG TPA: hypothetical protein VGG33_08090 [Polyangia bacterium]
MKTIVKTRTPNLSFVLGIALLGACGGSDKPPPADGAPPDASSDVAAPDATGDTSGDLGRDGGDAGAPDAMGSDGGTNTTPITERPSRGTYTCRVERPRTDHTPRYWQSLPGLVTTTAGTAQFLRSEAMTENPIFPVMPKLTLGTMGKDGSFGPPSVVAEVAGEVGSISAAPRADGLAAIWIEGTKLRFAAFDANSALVVAPKDIATGVDVQSPPKLAGGPAGGFGVLYATAAGFTNREVHFLALDADGMAKAPARRIDQAQVATGFIPQAAFSLAGGATGYAMIWRALGEARGGIDFAKAGADGSEVIARRRISLTNQMGHDVGGGAGFESPTTALLETASGYIAAWPEVRQSMSFDGGAWATVNLVRVSAEGGRQGTPVPLRTYVDSIDEVEPSLIRFGDAVGVLWARGKHIYICAGCVPDHRIDLLLIDPADLTPVSNLVSVLPVSAAKGGGLLRRQVAVLGSSILTTFDTTFHVHHTSTSATFACER